jgi:hypothetical protein
MSRQLVRITLGMTLLVMFCSGCVERQLTINTTPPGARIWLNDEDMGESPVTTPFKWYGDYNVRITKPGFQTLHTHRPLEAPWYDTFPFDFLAQIVNPQRIVDAYDWTFELQPKQPVAQEALIAQALSLSQQLEATTLEDASQNAEEKQDEE